VVGQRVGSKPGAPEDFFGDDGVSGVPPNVAYETHINIVKFPGLIVERIEEVIRIGDGRRSSAQGAADKPDSIIHPEKPRQGAGGADQRRA